MRSIIYYIILSCFIFVFEGRAQETEMKYLYEINWSEPRPSSDFYPGSLAIAGQQGVDEATGLPVETHKYQLPYGVSIKDVDLDIKVMLDESLSGEEQQIINNIKDDFPVLKNYFIAYENKKPQLNVEVIPVYFDENGGVYKKIKKYTLDINIKSPVRSLKTAKQASSEEYAANSVLAGGKWVKIKIIKDGVYRIPYSYLKSWGFSDPSKVKVFGNGGIMLPKANSELRFDDLRENAVWHDGDAVYFYGKGSVKWEYSTDKKMWIHKIHDYSDDTYYFLSQDAGEGVEVGLIDNSSLTPNIEVASYDAYDFHEIDEKNLLKSGRTWYGEWFSYYGKQSESFGFQFKNLIPDSLVKIYTSAIARANVTSKFDLFVNGDEIPVQTLTIRSISFSDYTGYYAHEDKEVSSFYSSSDDVNVEVRYNLPANTSQGWLDFLCLNAKCELKKEGSVFAFRDVQSVGEENIAKYYLGNANSNTIIWDISDYTRPVRVKGALSGNTLSFVASASKIREYVAFDPGSDIPVPEFVEDVANQNLHAVSGVDYIIVAYKDYVDQANRLASIHQANDGISTLVVTSEKIYNEFSSGKPDISAIRDFMRMLYKKASSKAQQPKYLLLFGDGSYDNRTYDDKNTNRILTYQSVNSIHHAYSYVSDDFFGFLDDDEGENIQRNLLDIGIGRFPVNTTEEAKDIVDKVEKYIHSQNSGKWKALLTFIGDDGDNNIHMRDADRLARKTSVSHPEFDMNKIYFDSYQKITTSTGKAYPEVNTLIDEIIASGTLVFNYTGHGGENGLAHEKVVTIPGIQAWTNIDRLPLFVTATCEFSRFDDPDHISAGEWVVLNSLGGGIGLFTTTRLVYSSLNFIISNNLYNYIFERDENGDKLKLGDIMRLTKNASGTSVNKLNFTLLADPALSLVYPSNYVKTVTINDKPVEETMDTLKALSKAEIGGDIVRGDLSLINDYEGTLDITVYDKPTTVHTLGNDGAKPFEYEVFQNKLFTGQVSVKDGEFKSEFMVSKDIRYNIGTARVSYYSDDKNGDDAFGASNDIIVGGISDSPPFDNEGPEIRLYLNKPTFVPGGTTGIRPLLIAELYDENGINTSGNGIGHDITLVIDDKSNNKLVMNGYYQSEKDSYQKGTVVYQLQELEPGIHKLSFKAWDNLNNSSEVDIEFNVKEGGEMEVEYVRVFPNPVSYNRSARLYFTHDEPNTSLSIEVSTYNLLGQLMNKVQEKTVSQGGSIQPIQWLPETFDGNLLGPGLYIVRFKIMTPSGKTSDFSQKILVIE